jgi:shikimate dehydrogenase
MIRAAVIGQPIAHSKSPLIHQFWLEKLGISGSYDRIEVAPDTLVDFMRVFPGSGLQGVNITLPHKQSMAALCDRLTPVAAKIGAVNTLYRADNETIGYNTDGAGFAQPLASKNWQGAKAVIIGNGGAARAIVYQLSIMGFGEIRCMARRVSAAAELFIEFGLNPIHCFGFHQQAEALAGADLLVNATSLGMVGQLPLDIDISTLAVAAWVYDIVYAPLETPLLAQARAAGLYCVDGLEMLIGQAAEAFALFYGQAAPRSPALDAELRARLLV